MSDDELVKRLRVPDPVCQEQITANLAADRIAKLNEENDILMNEVEFLEQTRDDLQKAYGNAIAENDRFRKLLTDIVDEYNDQVHGPILHSIVAARTELEPKL